MCRRSASSTCALARPNRCCHVPQERTASTFEAIGVGFHTSQPALSALHVGLMSGLRLSTLVLERDGSLRACDEVVNARSTLEEAGRNLGLGSVTSEE